MSERHTVYQQDEETIEWIEEVGVEVFGSYSQLYKKALDHLRQEKDEELRELAQSDEPITLL